MAEKKRKREAEENERHKEEASTQAQVKEQTDSPAVNQTSEKEKNPEEQAKPDSRSNDFKARLAAFTKASEQK